MKSPFCRIAPPSPKPPKPPRPPPPAKPPPPPPRLRTGEPGLLYASCCRSHSFLGSVFSSRIQVRLRREARSDSESSAVPLSVYCSPPKRHSVFATWIGCVLNGACSASTLSRNGTLF